MKACVFSPFVGGAWNLYFEVFNKIPISLYVFGQGTQSHCLESRVRFSKVGPMVGQKRMILRITLI
jgi:hypothetical protein